MGHPPFVTELRCDVDYRLVPTLSPKAGDKGGSPGDGVTAVAVA